MTEEISHTVEEILALISQVPDPEIPVLTLTDLGIVKDIRLIDNTWEIDITPTYVGCPAMKTFEDDIVVKLKQSGIENVRVKRVLSPAWTTDWITEAGRNKLREYGIAPPVGSASKASLTGHSKEIPCPKCGSFHTEIISQFGSTPCKSLYKCLDCLEPFDYFKCI